MQSLRTDNERHYSYADYLNWNEGERWEIIDGVPYMQATPSREHQGILMALSAQFYNYLKGKTYRIYPAPFCVRLDAESDDKKVRNVLEPDITIVCDSSKLDDKGCKGAPDMIVEVLSPSTGKKDKLIKFNKYEKAGVKEYWIVEPESRLVNVFLLQPDGRYGRTEVYSDEDKIKVSIFEDLEIDLKEIFEEEKASVEETAPGED